MLHETWRRGWLNDRYRQLAQMIASPYDWLIPILFAPFVGSFLGLLAVRLPEGEDAIVSRSRCRRCGHVLRPWELVPIASWLWLGGRCGHCQAPIGWFYPAMEIAAVVVAVWAGLVTEGSLLWVSAGLGWTLLALAAMDLRSLILADVLTLPLVAAGFLVIAIIDASRLWLHLAGALAGFSLLVAVTHAYRRMRGREGLGLGDAKLMAGAGAWVGLDGIGSVLLYAAASGLGYATVMRITGKPFGADTEIPLGAGIALGLWLVWLYGPLLFAQ